MLLYRNRQLDLTVKNVQSAGKELSGGGCSVSRLVCSNWCPENFKSTEVCCSHRCAQDHCKNIPEYNTPCRRATSCTDCNGAGKTSCNICSGKGGESSILNCGHMVSQSHYYCTSISKHGNNVLQYHK